MAVRTPRRLASWPVMRPWEVEMIATPMPPRTLGRESLSAYTRRPGFDTRVMPEIKGYPHAFAGPRPVRFARLLWNHSEVEAQSFCERFRVPNEEKELALLGIRAQAFLEARTPGALLDVPLEELAAAFDRVILVDLIHPWPARLAARRYPNVALVTAEISAGLAGAWAELCAEADLIVSANLLSQIPLLPIEAHETRGREAPPRLGAHLVERFQTETGDRPGNFAFADPVATADLGIVGQSGDRGGGIERDSAGGVALAEDQALAQVGHVGAALEQVEEPRAVGGVAVEHAADQSVVLDHKALVNTADRIGQHDVFADTDDLPRRERGAAQERGRADNGAGL